MGHSEEQNSGQRVFEGTGVRQNDIQGNDIWGKVVQSIVIVAGKTVAKIVASQLGATNLVFHKPYQHKGKPPPLILLLATILSVYFKVCDAFCCQWSRQYRSSDLHTYI